MNLTDKILKNFPTDFLVSKWRWSMLIILALILYLAGRSEPFEKTFITSDGHGYYAHLPAFFIYHDLTFGFIDDLRESGERHTQNIDNFRRSVDGGIVNITYIGVALLWIPFFLLAHAAALITSFAANGYSTPYQLSLLMAGIFYLMLGLWAMGRFLEEFRVKPWLISFSLFLMVFASSALWYTIKDPGFTHVYTMSLFAILLLYIRRFSDTFRMRHLWICAVALALIGLIRPTNAIMVLAIPVAAGSWIKIRELFLWIITNPRKVLLPALVFGAILAIQPVLYFIQTGSFFVWSYQGATFDFTNPEIFNVLFSYEAGLFLYTPLLLFSFFGLGAFFTSNRFVFIWLLLSIAVAVYVQASWWNWWFGMSFGHRAFIDYYPLFFLAIAYGFSQVKRSIIIHFFVFAAILLVMFNHIQMKQYRDYVYYWKMDRDMYWQVFLRTSKPYHGFFWEEEKYQKKLITLQERFPVQTITITRTLENPHEHRNLIVEQGKAHTGLYSARMGEENEYNDLIRFYLAEGPIKMGFLAQVFVFPEENPIKQPVYLIFEVYRDEDLVFRRFESTNYLNPFSWRWNRVDLMDLNGFEYQPGDKVMAYFHNPHKSQVNWDNFSVTFFTEENIGELRILQEIP